MHLFPPVFHRRAFVPARCAAGLPGTTVTLEQKEKENP
jgi:hypothetical protein